MQSIIQDISDVSLHKTQETVSNNFILRAEYTPRRVTVMLCPQKVGFDSSWPMLCTFLGQATVLAFHEPYRLVTHYRNWLPADTASSMKLNIGHISNRLPNPFGRIKLFRYEAAESTIRLNPPLGALSLYRLNSTENR